MKLIADELVSVQPMSEPTTPTFFIDFVIRDDSDDSEFKNSSPWSWRTLKWNDGTWIANYNNDVFEMEYSANGFEIVRLWRHQLKKWIKPSAEDYGELRRISKIPRYEVSRLRELRINPRKEEDSFTKFAFPLINRLPQWFETSHVTKSADRINYGT